MPKFLEDRLKTGAAAKHLTGKRAAAYTYGTMNNLGAMHGSKVTAKGIAMERKHERDLRPHVDRGHRNVVNPASHAAKLRSS